MYLAWRYPELAVLALSQLKLACYPETVFKGTKAFLALYLPRFIAKSKVANIFR
jgi:hypothetical protein